MGIRERIRQRRIVEAQAAGVGQVRVLVLTVDEVRQFGQRLRAAREEKDDAPLRRINDEMLVATILDERDEPVFVGVDDVQTIPIIVRNALDEAMAQAMNLQRAGPGEAENGAGKNPQAPEEAGAAERG